MSYQIWITAETAREEGGKQDRWLALVWTRKLCDFCHHDASQALFLHLQGKDIMCLSLLHLRLSSCHQLRLGAGLRR